MFSNRALGEQWVREQQGGQAAMGGKWHPGNYRQGAGMGR